jgi:hypothetical protein
MRILPRLLVVIAGICVLGLAHAVLREAAAPAASLPPPGVRVHAVRPTQADPPVTGPDSPSLAMVDPRSRSNGLLLVFLPGTGGQPACCRLFLRTAASLGYLAIGLTYDNQTAVGIRCLNDLSCFGTVRRDIFDGTDPSANLSLPRRDGIEHRLTSLLSYLARRYPREGWGRFLSRRRPLWSRIVISGHSQGGGEAALIGAIRRLRGVVTLSSPPDTNLSHQAATWVSGVRRGRTPIGRIIAFVHAGDPFYPRILADWTAMGLGSLGSLGSVDNAAPPYRHTHELISSAPLPAVVLAEHDSTAVDSATPACPNGSPRYAPVWDYMLEVAGGLPIRRGKPAC